GKGLTTAFVHALPPDAELAKLTGRQDVGTFLPFERIPILQEVCTTLKARYVGDHDELVGRVAMVLQPEAAGNARRLGGRAPLNTGISAPLVVADQAIGAISVVGPGLRESDLPA